MPEVSVRYMIDDVPTAITLYTTSDQSRRSLTPPRAGGSSTPA